MGKGITRTGHISAFGGPVGTADQTVSDENAAQILDGVDDILV